MNETTLQFSQDWTIFLRILTAFGWGAGYGYWLHFTKTGQVLDRQHTWLATSIGLGVDLLLAFPGDWFMVVAVIAASAVPIAALARIYGYPEPDVNFNSNKVKWGLEDAVSLSIRLTEHLTCLLETEQLTPETVSKVSKIIALTHRLKSIVVDARRGEYQQRKV